MCVCSMSKPNSNNSLLQSYSGWLLLSFVLAAGAVQLEAVERRQRPLLCDSRLVGRLQWHVGDAAPLAGHPQSCPARSCDGCDGTAAIDAFPRSGHHVCGARLPLRIGEDHCARRPAGDQCAAICDAGDTPGGATEGDVDQLMTQLLQLVPEPGHCGTHAHHVTIGGGVSQAD